MENQHQQKQKENAKNKGDCKLEDKFEILLSTLELRLPLPSCEKLEEEEDRPDEYLMKTPRSLEPAAVLECPPPPRKPRRFPSAKRKASAGGRAILMAHDYLFGEMELELELLFPSNLLGGKIVKKIKRSVE